jgi:hypothetical protein
VEMPRSVLDEEGLLGDLGARVYARVPSVRHRSALPLHLTAAFGHRQVYKSKQAASNLYIQRARIVIKVPS